MQITWSTTDDDATTREGAVFIFSAQSPESLLLTIGKRSGRDAELHHVPMVPGLRIAITE